MTSWYLKLKKNKKDHWVQKKIYILLRIFSGTQDGIPLHYDQWKRILTIHFNDTLNVIKLALFVLINLWLKNSDWLLQSLFRKRYIHLIKWTTMGYQNKDNYTIV